MALPIRFAFLALLMLVYLALADEVERVECPTAKWNQCRKEFDDLQKTHGYIKSCSALPNAIDCLEDVMADCCEPEKEVEIKTLKTDLDSCNSKYSYNKEFFSLNVCKQKTSECLKDLPNNFTKENKMEECKKFLPAAACIDSFRHESCNYRELNDEYKIIDRVPAVCKEKKQTDGICSTAAVNQCLKKLKTNSDGKNVCDEALKPVMKYTKYCLDYLEGGCERIGQNVTGNVQLVRDYYNKECNKF